MWRRNFWPILGDGIFSADGQNWLVQRKRAANMFKVANFKVRKEEEEEEGRHPCHAVSWMEHDDQTTDKTKKREGKSGSNNTPEPNPPTHTYTYTCIPTALDAGGRAGQAAAVPDPPR